MLNDMIGLDDIIKQKIIEAREQKQEDKEWLFSLFIEHILNSDNAEEICIALSSMLEGYKSNSLSIGFQLPIEKQNKRLHISFSIINEKEEEDNE